MPLISRGTLWFPTREVFVRLHDGLNLFMIFSGVGMTGLSSNEGKVGDICVEICRLPLVLGHAENIAQFLATVDAHLLVYMACVRFERSFCNEQLTLDSRSCLTSGDEASMKFRIAETFGASAAIG